MKQGIAPLYGIVLGLVITSTWGWPYVLAFVLIAGPWLGKQHAQSPNQEKDKSHA